jgi:hypothetical protein
MSNDEQQTSEYAKMLQVAYELGLGQYFNDPQKPSISLKFSFENNSHSHF